MSNVNFLMWPFFLMIHQFFMELGLLFRNDVKTVKMWFNGGGIYLVLNEHS